MAINELEHALRTGQTPAERKGPQSAPDSSPNKRPARSAASSGSSRSASASGYGTARSSERVVERSSEGSAETKGSPESISNEPSKPISGTLVDQIKFALEKMKRPRLVASLDAAMRVELVGDDLLIEFTPEAKQSRDTLAKADASVVAPSHDIDQSVVDGDFANSTS